MKLSYIKSSLTLGAGLLLSNMAFADALAGEAEKQATNWTAIIMFAIFVGFTLFITKWAAKQTQSTSDFYTGGGGISGFQNGLAIAGDYMSAASFLGISAMVFSSGYDGLLYSLGFMVGWPVVLFLVAERLRNLGKYNFSDVVSFRLDESRVRKMAAFSSLVVVAFLPYRSNGRCRSAYQATIWLGLYHCCSYRRTTHDGIRNVWWYASNHLGTNHQGGHAAIWSKLHGIYGHETRWL